MEARKTTPTEPVLTGPMRRVQDRLGRPLGEDLEDRYIRQGLTLEQIASDPKYGLSITTLSRWLAFFGIEARFPGQRGTAA